MPSGKDGTSVHLHLLPDPPGTIIDQKIETSGILRWCKPLQTACEPDPVPLLHNCLGTARTDPDPLLCPHNKGDPVLPRLHL